MAIVLISQSLLTVGLVSIGTLFSRHYLRAAFDVNLEGRAMSVAALTYYPDDGSPGLLFNHSKIPPSANSELRDIFWVQSDHGDFETHTPGLDQKTLQLVSGTDRYAEFEFNGQPYRAIILRGVRILDTEEGIPEPLPRLTVMYASPTVDISRRLTALASSFAVCSVLLLLPVIAFTVRTSRRGLAPLNALAESAKTITVTNWHFDPPQEAHQIPELEPLVHALHTVLDRLHKSFDNQRQFLDDAAHELKTAHAILKSSLQLAFSRSRSTEEYREALAVLHDDSDRLEELLKRMLRLGRLDQWSAERHSKDFELCDLNASCEMAAARLSASAKSRQVSLDLFCPRKVFHVRADAEDLEMIWVNLLENALQHSSAGSSVRMSVIGEDQGVQVIVEDHGCGIAADELPYIFERFRRGDRSRSRETGGVGLGLAMAKSAVEAFGGSIRAESILGAGTHFFVKLPVEDIRKSEPITVLTTEHLS